MGLDLSLSIEGVGGGGGRTVILMSSESLLAIVGALYNLYFTKAELLGITVTVGYLSIFIVCYICIDFSTAGCPRIEDCNVIF